jgi:hypothetical protein
MYSLNFDPAATFASLGEDFIFYLIFQLYDYRFTDCLLTYYPQYMCRRSPKSGETLLGLFLRDKCKFLTDVLADHKQDPYVVNAKGVPSLF